MSDIDTFLAACGRAQQAKRDQQQRHFRVERIPGGIRIPGQQPLRWAVVCVATGGRFNARRTKREAEAEAARCTEAHCWCCAERARGEHVCEVGAE